jgi:hypothetical protein
MRNDWIGNGTRNVLERAAAAVMIFILLWKIFQFLVFLPLSGAAHFGDYLPFALEFILAFISLVLSFTKHRIASFAVASVLALVLSHIGGLSSAEAPSRSGLILNG